MLRVIEILEPPADVRFGSDEYQPVNFDWGHDVPVSFWSIEHGRCYLMIGYEHRTGRVISVETPLHDRAEKRESACWDLQSVESGHPRIAVVGPEWKVIPDPMLQSFVVDYSRTDVKLRWGTDTKRLRSGRCMFGLDEVGWLVSVGVVDLDSREHAVLCRALAPPRA